jgi:hypothetical protein
MMTEIWDLPGLRRRSQLLFGSRHRLPAAVFAATAGDGELFARAIADRAEIGTKDAVRLLNDWEVAGLLEPASPPEGPRRPGGQPQCFQRRDDQFWSCMQLLGEKYRR